MKLWNQFILREEKSMRRILVIVAVIVFSINMFGCKKKELAIEELQEPMSMEVLSTLSPATPTTAPAKASEASHQLTQGTPLPAVTLESLPPGGPYKPSASEIQAALKNAGLYAGEIDGKIGPMTKKAIEEFQKANGLQVDGKIGTKTWAVLSQHLNPVISQSAPIRRR